MNEASDDLEAQRAGGLAKEAGLTNVRFQVMDALNMEPRAETKKRRTALKAPRFESNSFDLVWGCESGEHMPDKKKCPAFGS